jgi:transcriptional regulator with XRE-family HTH domain
MDDQRIGHVLRALRQRKGWRQQDVGDRAGVSDTLVARIERGAFASIPLGKIRRVAETLGARFDTILRWQGADLGRLLDSRHAAMHESMARFLGSLDGWQFEPEVSFSIYGERGIIDILAWHPGRRMHTGTSCGPRCRSMGVAIGRWLRDPSSRIDALSFLPDRRGMTVRRPSAPVRRVRAPRVVPG